MTQNQIDGGKQIRSGTVTSTQLSGTAGITDGQLATSYVKADGTRAFTADIDAGSHKVINQSDGVADTDSATVGQMKALVNGLDQKASVRVATTAAGTLASSFANGSTVDGVTLATGDPILIKDQAAGAENGVYTVNATGAPTRRADADANAEVTGGFTVWVNEGTTNGDSQWTLTTNDPIVIGTTALTFTQTDKNALTFTGGLTKTGTQVKRDDLTGDVTTTGNGNATTIATGAVSLAKMANLAANSVIGNLTGSAAAPAATAATSAATASTVATRDANANIKSNAHINGVATTSTSAGTKTLTVADPPFQQFTGATTHTLVLPNATTLVTGQPYVVANRSTGAITVNANGGGNIGSVSGGSMGIITLINNGTAAGTWDFQLAIASAAGTLSTANFVDRETPTGTVNGSNTTFTLANTPTAGTESVYLNGLLQEPGAGNDYTISGATITYLTAPVTGDKIRVSYRK
jgi:hypothetical protein